MCVCVWGGGGGGLSDDTRESDNNYLVNTCHTIRPNEDGLLRELSASNL